MSNEENWAIEPIAAHYFHGPLSNSENGHRTMLMVLRAVADWIEQNNLQDPDLVGSTTSKSFIGEDDEHCETLTLYCHPSTSDAQKE